MKKLVVLTGAGMSAESGLKTFRDSDGLWEGYDVREVATPAAWKKNPALVLEFYNERRRNVAAAKPNPGHLALAQLQENYETTIITQNIDDLHELAGSSNVIHLHGEIFKMRSELDDCQQFEIRDKIQLGDKAPDGGQLRPAIVWFGEPVPLISAAAEIVSDADIFVIIGTSLAVYPAAGLVHYAQPNIPKYIIDRKIPYTVNIPGLKTIEKNASEGAIELQGILMQML